MPDYKIYDVGLGFAKMLRQRYSVEYASSISPYEGSSVYTQLLATPIGSYTLSIHTVGHISTP